jgi:hypothetical protein
MQAHTAEYLTKTEVGVINNYKEVQNVNTGDNYGMFNLGSLMFKSFICILTGFLIQNVNNQGV